MPRWCLGWDVVCRLGQRRFARHWSVPQLRAALQDTYAIRLSDDAIASYRGRYQTMLAARQQDPERLADDYRDIASLVLTIDGLQPEKGHETLYVVRELRRKRVWFAEPLLSSATQEGQRVIALARQWAERLDKPVGGCGCRTSRMRSCRRLVRSFPQPLTAIATTTFCGMWPSPCWSWTVRRRSRCGAKYEGWARSNAVCWRIVGTSLPLSLPPPTGRPRQTSRYVLTSLKRRRPRPVYGALWAWARSPMPWTPRLGR